MNAKTRVKIGTGVSLACDAIAIGAGTAGIVFHIKELKDGTYDVLKDGIRDLGSGILIGSGAVGIFRTCKNYKTAVDVAETADRFAAAASKAVTDDDAATADDAAKSSM